MEIANKITHLAFNNDNSCFACATIDGFNVYSLLPTPKEILKRDMYELGEIYRVEILERSNIIAFVGNSDKYPRTKLIFWDDNLQKPVSDIQFSSEITGFHIYTTRLLVLLKDRTYVYDLQTLQLLNTIDTAPNLQGVGEWHPATGILITLGTAQGTVRVWRTQNKFEEIAAHDGPIQCLKLDPKGKLLATTSTRGTLIRVFDLTSKQQPIQPQIYRRGLDPAVISSIIFDATSSWLCVSSSTETIHIFAINMPSSQMGWWSWSQSFISSEIKSTTSLKLPREIEGLKTICCFNEKEKAIIVLANNGLSYRFNIDWNREALWDKPFDSFSPFLSDF